MIVCKEIAADIFECCISTSFKMESKVLSLLNFLIYAPTKIPSFILFALLRSSGISAADIKKKKRAILLHSFDRIFH
jgi:hypothetical protein